MTEQLPLRYSSIGPLTADEIASVRRDRGIHRAASHARSRDPEWQIKALAFVRLYAKYNAVFMAEDVRAVSEAGGLRAPTDPRAWGAVLQEAKRHRIVAACGYAPANSSNRSPKVRWSSLICA